MKFEKNYKKYKLIIEILLKINPKYVWWHEKMPDCGIQSYGDSNDEIDFDSVAENGINCVGLLNIIRRTLGLEVPGVIEEKKYSGGTYEWYKYLKKNKKLKKLD